MKFDTIEDAYHFVSNAAYGDRSAIVHRHTGIAYFASVVNNYDDYPADAATSDAYLALPHKKDFDLGRPVVIAFVQEHCPQLMSRILGIFERSAAYRRYKELLTEMGLIEVWYVFAEAQERAALRTWCQEQGLTLD